MWIQVCIGHSGVYREHYRDVKGRLFVSHKLIFGDLEVYGRLDIYNRC